MRCWQYQGFNKAAMDLLNQKVKVGVLKGTITYTDGRKPEIVDEDVMEFPYTKEVYGERNPWYDEKMSLHIYRFSDGRVLEDYIQAEPWSSGPCTFMALRDHVTKEPLVETLWDQDTIDRV